MLEYIHHSPVHTPNTATFMPLTQQTLLCIKRPEVSNFYTTTTYQVYVHNNYLRQCAVISQSDAQVAAANNKHNNISRTQCRNLT